MSEDGLYLFGPAGAPVGLAGISDAIRTLGGHILRFSESDVSELYVLEGGPGTGKTSAAVAAQAESENNGVACTFVNPGSSLSEILPLIGRGQVERLVVD